MPPHSRILALSTTCFALGCKLAESAEPQAEVAEPTAVAPPAVVPAEVEHGDQTSTPEAKGELARMYSSLSSYLHEEYLDVDGSSATPQCPNDGRAAGSVGITPPLSVNCAEGPDGRCVPGGTGPGGYPKRLWTENTIWKALRFELEEPHRFHYEMRWHNDAHGCTFTMQAFGDLDDDGIYSTYERSGLGDWQGLNSAMGLYIDREFE